MALTRTLQVRTSITMTTQRYILSATQDYGVNDRLKFPSVPGNQFIGCFVDLDRNAVLLATHHCIHLHHSLLVVIFLFMLLQVLNSMLEVGESIADKHTSLCTEALTCVEHHTGKTIYSHHPPICCTSAMDISLATGVESFYQ